MSKPKKYYMVMKLLNSFSVNGFGLDGKFEREVKMPEGQFAVPAFSTKRAARAVYGKDVQLVIVTAS